MRRPTNFRRGAARINLYRILNTPGTLGTVTPGTPGIPVWSAKDIQATSCSLKGKFVYFFYAASYSSYVHWILSKVSVIGFSLLIRLFTSRIDNLNTSVYLSLIDCGFCVLFIIIVFKNDLLRKFRAFIINEKAEWMGEIIRFLGPVGRFLLDVWDYSPMVPGNHRFRSQGVIKASD